MIEFIDTLSQTQQIGIYCTISLFTLVFTFKKLQENDPFDDVASDFFYTCIAIFCGVLWPIVLPLFALTWALKKLCKLCD